MEVTILSIRNDRKTGEVISKEIVGSEEVNEEEYYNPLVKYFLNKMKDNGTLEKCMNGGE